jgi:hypothetical protein
MLCIFGEEENSGGIFKQTVYTSVKIESFARAIDLLITLEVFRSAIENAQN